MKPRQIGCLYGKKVSERIRGINSHSKIDEGKGSSDLIIPFSGHTDGNKNLTSNVLDRSYRQSQQTKKGKIDYANKTPEPEEFHQSVK